jgi:hypothetical protein
MERDRLPLTPIVERTYDPDRQAMLAALRAVLELPRRAPGASEWSKP